MKYSVLLSFLVFIFCNCHQDKANEEATLKNVDSLNSLAFNLLEIDKNKAIYKVNIAIGICQKINYPKGLSDAYARKGLYFDAIEQHDSAHDYYLKSLKIRKEINDNKLLAFAYSNLGSSSMELKKWELAKSYIDSASVLFYQIKDTLYLMKINQQYGKYFSLRDEFEKAIPYFLYGRKLSLISKNNSMQMTFNQSLGNAYSSMSKYDSAKYYYNLWGNWLEESGLNDERIEYCESISAMEIEQGHLTEASKHIAIADSLIKDSFGEKEDERFITERKMELAEARGDMKAAFSLSEKLRQEQQDLYLVQSKNISELEVSYRTKEKEGENRLLKLENNRKTWITNMMVVLSLMVLLAGLLFLRFFRQKRKLDRQGIEIRDKKIDLLVKEQDSKTMSAILEGQDNERKRIGAELHDRLGGLLSAIKLHSNLLQRELNALQKKEDAVPSKAIALLDEAVAELRRISHNLYSSDIEKLGLEGALKFRLQQMGLHEVVELNGLSIPDLPVPVKVNLLNVILELLNNTLKYAKANKIIINLRSIGNEALHIDYSDDGKGFDTSILARLDGIGYNTIDRRIKTMNGTWEVQSAANQGVKFHAVVPI